MADSPEPVDPKRPDLEDSTNVTQAHASLLETGAAQAREKKIEESGMEPVSLWVFLASAVVLLVGGGVMRGGGDLFSYDPLPKDYIRSDFPDGGPEKVEPTGPAMEVMMKKGANLYLRCGGCHGSDGSGDGGDIPPLAGSEWVTGKSEILGMIILNGVTGPISVNGKVYGGKEMVSQNPLSQEELAALMTYVRNKFGETGDIVSVEQAAAAVALHEARKDGAPIAPKMTAEELKAKHDKELDGTGLQPDVIIDKQTLLPVAADEEAK